jgi:hypothetical protein
MQQFMKIVLPLLVRYPRFPVHSRRVVPQKPAMSPWRRRLHFVVGAVVVARSRSRSRSRRESNGQLGMYAGLSYQGWGREAATFEALRRGRRTRRRILPVRLQNRRSEIFEKFCAWVRRWQTAVFAVGRRRRSRCWVFCSSEAVLALYWEGELRSQLPGQASVLQKIAERGQMFCRSGGGGGGFFGLLLLKYRRQSYDLPPLVHVFVLWERRERRRSVVSGSLVSPSGDGRAAILHRAMGPLG